MTTPSITIVIPTLGRPCLQALLDSLARTAKDAGPSPVVVIVDDSRSHDGIDADRDSTLDIRVVRSGGRGPAAARNVGISVTPATDWIVFLDDDVVVTDSWWTQLHRDLVDERDCVAAVQGRIRVPLPPHRAPTDWERQTAGLETAWGITADLAIRRDHLAAVGGFDERFTRAFREDADLCIRLLRRGLTIHLGDRVTEHPVRSARWSTSIARQAGNADDVLMDRLHGRTWRYLTGTSRGSIRQHAAIVAGAALSGMLLPSRRTRLAGAIAGLTAAAGITRFARRRIAPGPRTGPEVTTMLVTSAVIPFAAVAHRVRGVMTWRDPRPWRGRPAAVLFDRDGTVIHDVPYNRDPSAVRLMAGARESIQRLRGDGIPVGLVTNQSGVGRGLMSDAHVDDVNREIVRQLGRLDVVMVCPHAPDDDCECRKPRPGMVVEAAGRLGVDARDVVVIGDIEADVIAAARAGATSILVPNARTHPDEIARSPRVEPRLADAVDRLLEGAW